jgi:peptide/nickel transport system permease protein
MSNPAVQKPAVAPRAARPARQRSLWLDSLRRMVRNPGAVLGLILLLLLIVASLLAPQLTSYDPGEIVPRDRLQGPGAAHWFGTDAFGRDIYTRVVFGTRISLLVGVVSVAIATLLGVTMGLLAGYFGGLADALIMRFVDVMLAFPGILLALVIVAVLGPDLLNAMIAVGISAAPTYARVTRGAVLQTKTNLYIEAATVAGVPTWQIVLRHLLPNILGPIVVVTTLGVAGAIISGASLSFLGLGAKPPTPEWGLMLSEGRQFLRQAWWITTFPGLAIMVTVLSINLLGDGLRDALDPRMQK